MTTPGNQRGKTMTDFGLYHVGTWRAGEMPNAENATHIVTYDQRSRAYQIEPGDYADFVEWVAVQWETGDLREDDESAADYLDRIGVDVRPA